MKLSVQNKTFLDAGFTTAFGTAPQRYFSAPGRTEIGGNHTDHQHGRVLAAAVNLDTCATVALNGTNTIRLCSEGFAPCYVNLAQLEPIAEEINTTAALVRGVAARFSQLGYKLSGFDAYCTSTVLPGSGLSSSAAFEVLVGTILNHLFCDGEVSAPMVAQIGQYAENVFFGKPCGLMDQTASSVGGLVSIDFQDPAKPVIRPAAFDFSSQFITGLLYALPMLEGDSEIVLTTKLESKDYVDMTILALEAFGVVVDKTKWGYRIPGGQRCRARQLAVESDYSQAAFYYAANGLRNQVSIEGLNPHSAQGDMRISPYYIKLCGDGYVELDVSQCPDLVPALAVHAALRAGQTTAIVNAARLRMKESDRLSAVTQELNKLGANIEEHPDHLIIHGVDKLHGGQVDAHNDHRIAMMLAIAATRADGPVTLTGAESVEKSYPNFWEHYQSLGGQITVH